MTTALPMAQDRACGPCSACCTLLAIPELVNQTGKGNHTKCVHDERAPTGCCAIHGERQPVSCQTFVCRWLAGSAASVKGATPEQIKRAMLIDGDVRRRPDNLGLMFSVTTIDQTQENILTAWEVRMGAALEQAYFLDKLVEKHSKVLLITTLPERVAMILPDRLIMAYPFKTSGFRMGPPACCAVCGGESGGVIPAMGVMTDDLCHIFWPKCSHGKFIVCDGCFREWKENQEPKGCPVCGCSEFFT